MHRNIITAILIALVQGFTLAQEPQYEVKVDVDSVFLNVSVREKATNRSLAGLHQDDFEVYEDGVRQEIEQFLPTEAPFNLLLLLDVSGSTGSFLKLMKQASIEFTRQINAEDRIAVATFNSKCRLVEDFTGDREAAERAIKKVRSGGGTAFYDALMESVTRYTKGLQGRTAIVVFTDGVDNRMEGMPESGSKVTFDELYREVQESETIIYTIFLDNEEQSLQYSFPPIRRQGSPGWPSGRRRGSFPNAFPFPFPFPPSAPLPKPDESQWDSVYRLAREQLQLIADQTGGRMYAPRKIGELSGVYAEIADDLRVQYQLGYNSTNTARDGKWRDIRVKVGNKPEAVVRTRRGYYARLEEGEAVRETVRTQ